MMMWILMYKQFISVSHCKKCCDTSDMMLASSFTHFNAVHAVYFKLLNYLKKMKILILLTLQNL